MFLVTNEDRMEIGRKKDGENGKRRIGNGEYAYIQRDRGRCRDYMRT